MKIKVSELVVKYLEMLGIDTLFGMPGAHILPVYDALYDSCIQSVLVKHEQGAAFMAGGYARVGRNIGACITTAGPGATNLVTGIANAYADKLPVIVITGEAPTYLFGKGGLQESSGEGGSIDQSRLFAGISRYHKIIERSDYLGNVLNRATQILFSDTPGPVVLSLPYNIQNETVDDKVLQQVHIPGKQRHLLQADKVQRFLELLQQSRSPVIVSGHGCIQSDASRLVDAISAKLDIPVCSSLKAKGTIDETSKRSLGSLGVTSSGYAYDYIVNHADLIIILGAGFNERTSYLWNEKLLSGVKIIQVDQNAEQLEKVYHADLAIHADIRDVLEQLEEAISLSGTGKKHLIDIEHFKTNRDREAQARGENIFDEEDFALVKQFYRRLEKQNAEMAIFDDNIIFAQNFFNVPGTCRYYSNSGISSLGHAIPAAVGAQFSDRKSCYTMIGDGGFQMCCMELMTAVNYQIPLNVVIFNNGTMGLIRKNQIQAYNQRFIDCDFINPDYKTLARAFGINHFSITSENDINELFESADLIEAINLIEIPIDKNAFPNYTSRR